MFDDSVYELKKKYSKQMDEIKNEIAHFSKKEKMNFCKSCLEHRHPEKEYASSAYETFFCDGCGEMKEVTNVSIANLLEEKGISQKDNKLIGGPKIYFNDKLHLWLK